MRFLVAAHLMMAVQLCLATTHLKGTLKRTDDNSGRIEITIINDGEHDVSLLAQDNVFDTRHDSIGLEVRDSAGNQIPTWSTHLCNFSAESVPLVDVPRGGEYKRQVDLATILGTDVESGAAAQILSLSIPTEYSGIIYNDDEQRADGQATHVSRKRTIPLARINISSESLEISFQFKTTQNPLRARNIGASGLGLRIAGDTLDDEEFLSLIETGIIHLEFLAEAGLNAAKLLNQWPFKWFFLPSHAAAVSDMMTRILKSVRGEGPTIWITSDDRRGQCNDPYMLAYARYGPEHEVGGGEIVICSSVKKIPTSIYPCMVGTPTTFEDALSTSHAGSLTLGAVFVHEMTHILSNGWIRDFAYGTVFCRADASADLFTRNIPMFNADHYASFASWAYDLGYKQPGRICPGNFVPWTMLLDKIVVRTL